MIPKSVRALALKHQISVGKDSEGNYTIRDHATGHVVEMTRSVKPTAKQATAMIRRYLKHGAAFRSQNPAGRLVDSIGPGDRVTIVNRFGQERTGRAVMRSSHGGWVLNMGGAHGTPGIADDSNITRVKKARGKNPRRLPSQSGDPADEWERAAAFVARRGKYPKSPTGAKAFKLGRKFGARVRKAIDLAPHEFLQRAHDYGYGISMTARGHDAMPTREGRNYPMAKRNPVENKTHALKAISVKYIGATNYKPSRYKAFDSDNNSVTIETDHALDAYENAAVAAERLQEKMGWKGTLIGGHTKEGYVFTFRTVVTRHAIGPLENPARRRSLKSLEKEAGDAAKFRGHTLGKWHGIASRKTAWASCVDCGKTVFVDKAPPPNGIDISGEAVALNCATARKELNQAFQDGGSASKFDAAGRRRNPEYEVIDMENLPDRSGRTVPVDEKTRKILRVGMKRKGHKIISFEPPPDYKPASSGHVVTDKGRYYIGVIGGEYIKPVSLVKNPAPRPQTFKSLGVGDEFEFTPSKDGFHHDRNRYIKVSERVYIARNGSRFRVGSVNVKTHNVKTKADFALDKVVSGKPWPPLKNPSGPFVIVAHTKAGQRLTFDATRNRFTNNSAPSLYATQIAAQNRANGLIKEYGAGSLNGCRVYVATASDKERGPVFGSRPTRRA